MQEEEEQDTETEELRKVNDLVNVRKSVPSDTKNSI